MATDNMKAEVAKYRRLDNKGVIQAAESIGINSSETTVIGHVVALAIGAGLRAKDDGNVAFTFDRAFDAFAGHYWPNASDGTLKNYRSSFNAFSDAGKLVTWDASELAMRVYREKGISSLSDRAKMLRTLLKGAKPPTAKEYADAKPAKSGGGATGSTIKGAVKQLQTSLINFSEKHFDKLTPALKAEFAEISAKLDTFATQAAVLDPAKPAPKGAAKKTDKKTFADRKAAFAAKLAALTSGKPAPRGTRTIQ